MISSHNHLSLPYETHTLSNTGNFLVILFLFLLACLPLAFYGSSVLNLALPVIAAYSIGFNAPSPILAFGVFFVGIALDVLAFAPIGFLAFLLLVCYGAGLLQKYFFLNNRFFYIWRAFVLFWIGFSLFHLWMVSWFGQVRVGWIGWGYGVIWSAIFFPFIYWIIMQIGHRFSE